MVTKVRDTIKHVTQIPYVGNTQIGREVVGLADHKKAKDAEQLSCDIVAYTESAKEVIEDIRIAFTQLDPQPIKDYREKLKSLDEKIRELPKKAA